MFLLELKGYRGLWRKSHASSSAFAFTSPDKMLPLTTPNLFRNGISARIVCSFLEAIGSRASVPFVCRCIKTVVSAAHSLVQYHRFDDSFPFSSAGTVGDVTIQWPQKAAHMRADTHTCTHMHAQAHARTYTLAHAYTELCAHANTKYTCARGHAHTLRLHEVILTCQLSHTVERKESKRTVCIMVGRA